MSKVIFRIERIKPWEKLRAAGGHNSRARRPANADPQGQIISILSPDDLEAAARSKIGTQTIRKNAVLAVEAIISASPEYFREEKGAAGTFDPVKMAEWRAAIEPWIVKEFPHAIQVQLHIDEATPHYHVIAVPLDEKGKLNAKKIYSGPATMRAWQDRAGAAVEGIGIGRGISKSVASHTRIKEYYANVMRPMAEIPEIKTPRPPEEMSIAEVIPGTKARKTRQKQEDQHYNEVVARNNAIIRTYAQNEDKLRHIPIMEKEIREKEATIEKLVKEGKVKDMRIERLREQANQLRALPLDDILKKMYNANETEKTKEGNKSHEYQLIDGQKIMITGDKWIDNSSGQGGKGAINLVMYLEQCEYKQAIKQMTEYFLEGAVATEYARHETAMATKRVQDIVAMASVSLPAPNEHNWAAVKRWLIESRGLPQKLVEWLKEKGKVYADIRANAVFPRRNAGAFLRGTTEKKWHQTICGKEGGPWIIPAAAAQERVVGLTESPLDAAALAAIKPEMEVWALGGNLIRPHELQAQLQNVQVWAAFDSDQAGDIMSRQAIESLAAKRAAPGEWGKDWAEAVRNHPELISKMWQDRDDYGTQSMSL